MAKVQVNINQSKIKELTNAANTALVKTAELVLSDVRDAQVIPFETGDMQNDKTFVDDKEKNSGKVAIVTDAPQARKLYYHPEFEFSQDHNPNAKGNWFDDWIDGNKKDFAVDTFKKLYKREANL
jgi:hypothetical protein